MEEIPQQGYSTARPQPKSQLLTELISTVPHLIAAPVRANPIRPPMMGDNGKDAKLPRMEQVFISGPGSGPCIEHRSLQWETYTVKGQDLVNGMSTLC